MSQRASGVCNPGSASHSPPPTPARSSRALPPRPRPPAVQLARRRRPAPLLHPHAPPAFILSLPFKDPGPCGPAQVGPRCTSPSTDGRLSMPRQLRWTGPARDTLLLSTNAHRVLGGSHSLRSAKARCFRKGGPPPAHRVHGVHAPGQVCEVH